MPGAAGAAPRRAGASERPSKSFGLGYLRVPTAVYPRLRGARRGLFRRRDGAPPSKFEPLPQTAFQDLEEGFPLPPPTGFSVRSAFAVAGGIRCTLMGV